jgi:hypothetical protein
LEEGAALYRLWQQISLILLVQMLSKKSNVVPITHNVKVVVAGAQMTTDSVPKEE